MLYSRKAEFAKAKSRRFDSSRPFNRPLAIRAESRILEEFKVGATLNLARVKGVL